MIINSVWREYGKPPLLVYGKGGHAKVVADGARLLKFSPRLIDDSDKITPDMISDKSLKVIVAIGDNVIREKKHRMLFDLGFSFASIIHPTAFVSNQASIGLGVYIGPNASVCADAVIQDGVIVNTNASVDHDCFLGSFTHVAPGVHICGGVYVDSRVLIGVGAAVIPSCHIGKDCIVAAGATVIDNLPDGVLVTGTPARIKL